MKDRLITEIEQAMVVEQTDKSKFDNSAEHSQDRNAENPITNIYGIKRKRGEERK